MGGIMSSLSDLTIDNSYGRLQNTVTFHTNKSIPVTKAGYQTKTMKGTDMEDYRVIDKYIIFFFFFFFQTHL
jgi:hypothetical protein